MEGAMRVMLVMAAATVAMFLGLPTGNAYEGPWCAVESGRDSGFRNCRMRTFEECRRDVIAGNRGQCTQNPNWPGWYGAGFVGAEPRPVRRRRAR
jgi:hypothetical protein